MRVLQINTVPYGSTGKIMLGIKKLCDESGIDCRIAYRYDENKTNLPDSYTVSSWIDCHMHNRLVRYSGLQGCFSRLHTARFIREIRQFSPDIIHLHNLHGSYINLPLLFRYIKATNIPVIWTLHDCWSFTGDCTGFATVNCDKWKTGCRECPQCREYPGRAFDNSQYMYRQKKKWFTGIENMVVVTPSEWLARLVGQSFLKNYPVKVINNGIDLKVFKPTPSDFRQKYAIPENKHIVLGVAFGWKEQKGLDVFIELADRLDHNTYQMVLAGTDESVDRLLPESVISIHRTHNQTELAEIYTAADVFVNPTRDDNYPTVNMESIACGTPVLTFQTGGSPEMLDKSCGSVVPCGDVDAIEKEIIRVCSSSPYTAEACVEHAKSFDMQEKFKEYLMLYEDRTYCPQRSI